MIRVVIDRKGISKCIESDFLGIAQASVEDFKIRPIRLKAEGESLVRIIVMNAFLGDEAASAVARSAGSSSTR